MIYTRPRSAEVDGGGRSRCYFDVYLGSEVYRDPTGVEAYDLSEVVNQARIAIGEYWVEDRKSVIPDAGALLVVRVKDQQAVFVLALDQPRALPDFRS